MGSWIRASLSGLRLRPEEVRCAGCLLVSAVFLLGAAAGAHASGSIYSWTDENGVRHFSNQPPASVEGGEVETVSEIPHDAEADRARELRALQWREQRDIEEAEEALRRAEERLSEAEARADDAEDRAEDLERDLEEAREDRDRYRVVVPYYPPYHRPRPHPPYWRPDPDRPHPPHWRPDPDRPRPKPLPGTENPRRRPRDGR